MNQLKIYVAFEGKTTDPALLSKVLTTLSQLELLAPGYWGAHERERKSWDVEAIIAFVARMKEEYRFYTSGIELWRTRAPRYRGRVTASDRTVNSIGMQFEPGPAEKFRQAVYEATDALVGSLPIAFALIHPIWLDGPDVEGASPRDIAAYMFGVSANAVDVHKMGLLPVSARTWYGPALAQRIGRERLLGTEGSCEQPSGAIRLDLAPEPWAAGFAELSSKKELAMKHLRPSGMFVDAEFNDSGGFTKRTPAVSWTPPDWVMQANPHLANS